jgi:hypothetical protein
MSYLPASVKLMFDTLQEDCHSDGNEFDPDDKGPASVPLERLEAQICELAGHLAAATCRFLVLLGDFDERRGWASWEMRSCAAWLSWKCQMSSGAGPGARPGGAGAAGPAGDPRGVRRGPAVVRRR